MTCAHGGTAATLLRGVTGPVVLALLFLLSLALPAAAQTVIDVGSASDLVSALTTVDNNPSTSYTINLTSDVTLTGATTLPAITSSSTVTVTGNGHTLDGSNVQRGLLVYSGTVSVSNLTIQNAVAQGGNGGAGGGGGMGAGGALFVANGANVTVSNVTLSNNQANGGSGAGEGTLAVDGGGGGGMGGNGGTLPTATGGGGGGGLGLGANGGNPGANGAAGIAAGQTSGGSGSSGGTGGANGGGGGGGQAGNSDGGGGGGTGGGNGTGVNGVGGAGGFGGGGGGGYNADGGAGGFGGGGGSSEAGVGSASGNGGFGGGGGGGGAAATGGSGGFGGGSGGHSGNGGGGGGAGLGGALFVQNGGTLTIDGTFTVNGNAVSGGTGGLGSGGGVSGGAGSAYGSGMFLQGNGTLTVSPASGETQTVSNVIADQTGSGGTGASAGTWALSKTGSGTLILNGVDTYSGGTTVSGGTLEVGDASHTSAGIAGDATVGASGTLAGHGTIGGDVTNSAGGIVAPGGSIGTLTVSGNYTQGSTSTLQIEVSPSAASKLAVSGAATLAGTLKLVYEPGVYTTKTYNILSASSVSGTFSTVSGTTPSGVSQSVAYSASDVDLVLTSLTVAPTNDTVFTSTGTSALLNGQQANASLLDHLAGLDAGTESDTFQNAFASFDDTEASAALAYAGPAKPDDNPLASLPQKMARIGGWFRGLGSFADLSGNGSTPGFSTSGGGFLAGVDRPVTNNLSAGIAGGYTRTSLSEDGGSSGSIDSSRFAFYGSYGFGAWAFDATLGYAYDRFSNSRLISSVGEVASSSHTGHEFDGALQVSRRFDLGGLTVLPEAGLQYVHLYERGFDEAGAPGFNLTVASRNSDSVRPFLGARFVKPWLTDGGMHMAVEADFAYSRELSDTPPSIVQVGGGSFTVDGLAPARDQLSLGTGITARMNDRLALFADYHATLPTGNLVQQTVKAGLNYVF